MKGELWKEDSSANASVLSTAVFPASDGGSGRPWLDVRLCRLHLADVQTCEMLRYEILCSVLILQVAQLSQRNRAAAWVSFGWNVRRRQYCAHCTSHCRCQTRSSASRRESAYVRSLYRTVQKAFHQCQCDRQTDGRTGSQNCVRTCRALFQTAKIRWSVSANVLTG